MLGVTCENNCTTPLGWPIPSASPPEGTCSQSRSEIRSDKLSTLVNAHGKAKFTSPPTKMKVAFALQLVAFHS